MINLIPVENWEYGIDDVIKGIATNIRKNRHHEIYLPGVGNCFTISSGRAGLIIVLQALGLKPGAYVGVPLYCCHVVLKAIEFAGLKPYYIDIETDTFCISIKDLQNKIDYIDAVIALHMFGNLSDMKAIRSISKNKPIIEDCAQALGSRKDDKIAGSFGDISFYSFRSGKYLSAGEGGAIFSAKEDIREKIGKVIASLHDIPCYSDILHVLKTYIRSKLRSKPLYGLVGHKLWAFYNKKTAPSAKAVIRISNIYKSDHATAVERLGNIDAVIAKQRENAGYYNQKLDLDEGMICLEKPGTFYNRYLYPIKFHTSKQRDLMAMYMYDQGIETIKPYHDIPEIAKSYYGYKGDCPISEKIADCLLAIPNHYKLTNKEVQHISLTINKGWVEIRDNK